MSGRLASAAGAAVTAGVLSAGALLAACGSSGAPSAGAGSAAGTPDRTAPATGSATAPDAATGAATATTRSPTPHTTSVPGAAALPTRAQLGSLTNYTYTDTVNSVAMAGRVHSPTDWQTTFPSVILHVDGATYAHIGSTWYRTAQPANQAHQGYATSFYPGTVGNFLGFLKVSGAVVTKGGACSEAGQAGTTFSIGSKPLNSSVLTEAVTACIADHGGAMLAEGLGAQGSGVANAAHAVSFSFTIDSIGDVPVIPVPSPVQTQG